MLRKQSEIIVSDQTILDAVQLYFATNVFSSGAVPVVESVRQEMSGYEPSGRFIVKTREPEAQ